jgi:hypothetical protein
MDKPKLVKLGVRAGRVPPVAMTCGDTEDDIGDTEDAIIKGSVGRDALVKAILAHRQRLCAAIGESRSGVTATSTTTGASVTSSTAGLQQTRPVPSALQRGFPRFWGLFRYALPRRIQERVFLPCYYELLEDYLAVQGRYRTPWARRWLKLCFTLRTVGMVAGCFSAMLVDKAVCCILSFLPKPVRDWLIQFRQQ